MGEFRVERVGIGGLALRGLESGGLGSAKLWLGGEVRRVGVEEVGFGGLGSGGLGSGELGSGGLGSGGLG